MILINGKITLTTLISSHLGDNLKVGDKMLDIRNDANAIAVIAKRQLDDKGEFAQVYASIVLERMEQIASQAEQAVGLLIMNNADVIPAELTPPPPKENLLVI